MSKILSFDISTWTGYGFWDDDRHISQIVADVIELPEARNKPNTTDHDFSWDDWRVAQAAFKYSEVIKEFRPDLILVEERLRFSKRGDGAFAMTNALHGAMYGQCMCWGIPFGTISSQSWRAVAYGKGFKQPLIPDLDRQRNQKRDKETGELKFKKKDWGDIAVEKCDKLNINLPKRKDISHNAAEAALISMMWRCKNRISIPSDWAQKKYMDMYMRPKSKEYEGSE